MNKKRAKLTFLIGLAIIVIVTISYGTSRITVLENGVRLISCAISLFSKFFLLF